MLSFALCCWPRNRNILQTQKLPPALKQAAQANHELHMFRGLAPLTRKASPAWDGGLATARSFLCSVSYTCNVSFLRESFFHSRSDSHCKAQ
jgi:hypothetical protein